jgi:ABC-type multidrug transport system ATPase subunit
MLDEPTAALDPYAEYEVYSKFNDNLSIIDSITFTVGKTQLP